MMNILIVSFDKALVNKLKDILKDYNVTDVKNAGEALGAVFPFIDIIIYDAIAGSISEEDINNLYRQKFKDAKYIILVDELFPVNMDNIIPPKKIRLMREEAIEKIRDAIYQEPGAQIETGVQAEEIISIPQKEFIELDKISFEELQTSHKEKRILIVSFDTELLNSLKEVLSTKFQIIEAKTPKEAMGKVEESDVIIFDTISGMLAYRFLVDVSKDEKLKNKPYILLIDELFTIDVDSIPLPEKYTFARTTELSKAIQKATEILERAPTEATLREEIPEVYEPMQPEEEKGVMSLLEEILGKEEVKEEPIFTDLKEEVSSTTQEEEEEKESVAFEAQPPKELMPPIEDIIKDQLSQEKIYTAISQVINYEDLKSYISNSVQSKVEEVLRETIKEVLSKIDIAQIVREEAYKVLKERLEELIT